MIFLQSSDPLGCQYPQMFPKKHHVAKKQFEGWYIEVSRLVIYRPFKVYKRLQKHLQDRKLWIYCSVTHSGMWCWTPGLGIVAQSPSFLRLWIFPAGSGISGIWYWTGSRYLNMEECGATCLCSSTPEHKDWCSRCYEPDHDRAAMPQLSRKNLAIMKEDADTGNLRS